MKRETVFLLTIVGALVLVGVLMVYSVSTVRSGEEGGAFTYDYLIAQLARVGIGIAALVAAAGFDYHHYRSRFILHTMLAGVLFLLVLVLFLAQFRNGASRWLTFYGFSMQPSDFAKATIVILLAVKLAENQEHIRSFRRGFLPPMVTTLFVAFLIALERDIGTPVVIGATALIMVMMAGARWLHLAVSLGPMAALVGLYVWLFPHAQERVYAWRDPMKYRSDESYQLIQSLWAFTRGGLLGLGPGAGRQKLHYLYAAESDFIFSVCGEEMGLFGTLWIVILFALFLVVAMRIAVCAPDLMGSLMAGGIAALIAIQAFVSMGVTTGLLPTKGLTLPFVSAGGTSLFVNLFLIGILVNIGTQAVERDQPPKLVPAV